MPGMKITLDAAMRVRDVSRPQPRHVAAALEADAQAAAAQAAAVRPGGAPASPAPARSAPTVSAPATPRSRDAGKRHRSRKRFPR
jgi:hypothetical protein